MSTAKFCIRHKVSTLLAVIMIVIFGAVFTTQLQMSLLPDMEAPMAVVVCYYSGATPGDIEELVSRPLETAVLSVPGVDEVSSTSSDSVSQLQITYVDGTDLDIAATKLREQFDMLSLPMARPSGHCEPEYQRPDAHSHDCPDRGRSFPAPVPGGKRGGSRFGTH